jgi:propanol-preferring alcohol dehydrogenase
MKAAVLTAIGRPLELAELPTPRLAPDEALVRTATCGLCRTDLHLQEGTAYIPSLPHVPGHEPAGTVIAVGAEVTSVRVGERVAPHLFVADGDCFFTRRGQHAQARHLRGIIGVTMPGGFAEHFVAPARNLLPLPEGLPFALGGLASCALVTAVHAWRRAQLESGDRAVVIGAGGVGAPLVQILCHAGIAVAVVERAADKAPSGAELAVAFDDPARDARIAEFADHGRGGVDCVFDVVGRSATVAAATGWLRPGGQVVVIGEEPEPIAIDSVRIAQRELRLVGSRNGGLDDAREALALMARGAVRPPIGARFALADINQAFDLARRGGASGRIVIDISGEDR